MNPEKARLFARMALLLKEASTCIRVQVGALLIKDGRPASSGYNGTASGQSHCKDLFAGKNLSDPEISKQHHEFSLKNENHAELNCLLNAAYQGISTKDCILFTTTSPCDQCAKAIVQAGIKEVYYIDEYDRDVSGIEYMKKNGINVIKVKI